MDLLLNGRLRGDGTDLDEEMQEFDVDLEGEEEVDYYMDFAHEGVFVSEMDTT